MRFGKQCAPVVAVLAAAVCGGTVFGGDYLVDPNYAGTNGAAANGYVGEYNSLAAAFASSGGVPSGASAAAPNRIFISPGTYVAGAASFSYSASNVALIGTTGNPNDVVITSYLDGAVSTIGTTNSSSLQLKGKNTTALNITFANSVDTPYIVNVSHVQMNTDGTNSTTAQTSNAPCVAIKLTGDEQAFQNCRFLGYQDTLYTAGGRAYFNNCYVSGDIDFIFAQGTSVFNNSQINMDGDHSGGTITAASTDKRTSNGLVIMNSTITANSVKNDPVIDSHGAANASGAAVNSMSLGRPWGWTQTGGDASSVFLNDKMSPAIKPAGWLAWNSNETIAGNANNGGNPAEDSRYAEFNSMDLSGNPLDVSQRVTWSHQLTASQAAAYTVGNLFSTEAGYPWFGSGYSGVADPTNPNYSWPAFWGPRNAQNDTANDNVQGNPTAYSDPSWSVAGSWDPTGQINSVLPVPEPASLGVMVAGAVALWGRRRR